MREVTLEQAKHEIHILALRIWAGVSLSFVMLSYMLPTITSKVPPRLADLLIAFKFPLLLGVVAYAPFAYITAHKRWIWADAKTIWKCPQAALQKIRINSPADIAARKEWRPRIFKKDPGLRDANRSVRILNDYLFARNEAYHQLAQTNDRIENGPCDPNIEGSIAERPLSKYEMLLMPTLIILISSIMTYMYFSGRFPWFVALVNAVAGQAAP